MKDKLLAEWFWVDRYDGSSAALMSMECQGVYRSMLSQAWRRGARLPNDHEAIRRAIRCSAKEWARAWPKVQRYWRVDGDSLVNDTQLEVYALAKASKEKASSRGRKGAQARAQALAQAKHEQPLKPVLKDQPPSPSPLTDTNSKNITPPIDNPLLGNFDARVSECLKLIEAVSVKTGDDPVEVFAKASEYRGAGKVNPRDMRPDRLLHTIRALKRRLEAKEPEAPPLVPTTADWEAARRRREEAKRQ